MPQSFFSWIDGVTQQNGGIFVKNCFPTTERNSWAKDHVQSCEVSGIGLKKEFVRRNRAKTLDGRMEYPPIGVYFANDPSGGQAMFALDYRECEKMASRKRCLSSKNRILKSSNTPRYRNLYPQLAAWRWVYWRGNIKRRLKTRIIKENTEEITDNQQNPNENGLAWNAPSNNFGKEKLSPTEMTYNKQNLSSLELSQI